MLKEAKERKKALRRREPQLIPIIKKKVRCTISTSP